ncbi:hypothetical protein GWI33_018194 [Rhynchophorus ferrugineus]|uniref:Uncharacterized protein n=1 Tax=Rhynchophorus ferrugineus TaxID=354439 RepID=A0A834HWV4_RHYFE|nr:hypothetical protein GWI33_018194 [Rhynchophorus ferrugineus]
MLNFQNKSSTPPLPVINTIVYTSILETEKSGSFISQNASCNEIQNTKKSKAADIERRPCWHDEMSSKNANLDQIVVAAEHSSNQGRTCQAGWWNGHGEEVAILVELLISGVIDIMQYS